jgi:hypothetical protein
MSFKLGTLLGIDWIGKPRNTHRAHTWSPAESDALFWRGIAIIDEKAVFSPGSPVCSWVVLILAAPAA